MKKIIRTIFVLVLSLVTVALAACDEKPEFTAEDVIKVLLVEQETYVTDDFVVPGVIKHKDVVYNLQWASDNNCLAVAAEMDANNNYKISVTRPDEYQAANLTATLVIGKTTATKKFEFSVYPVDVYELSEAYRFVYNNKTVSESFDLDATFALNGKTASITWSIPEAEAGKYTIEEGKVKFASPTKNIPTSIKAVFSFGGMETPMTYKFTLVPPTTVQNPKDGDVFKYGLYQPNSGKNLYITGKLTGSNNQYLATTDKVEEAADVTVHEVTGGYTLSIVVDGATKYVDIAEVGTYINPVIADEPTSPLQFNKEYYTFTKYFESKKTDYYLGTYGTYETFSASTISYAPTSFTAVLIDISKMPAQPTPDPDPTPDPEQPEEGGVITIAKALEICATKSHDTYTTEKYTITGTVASIYNTTFGNMTVTYGTNIITVYGTYSADGSSRFDAMTSKPSVGDTITVTGILGLYGSTKQMKNGWILSFTAHTHSYGEATCKEPAKCTICGVKKDDVLSSNHNYVDGLCTVCGGVDPDYEGEVVVPEGDMVADALALSFSNAKKDESANTYLETNFPKWTRNGNLGKNYAGYLGFGKGDKTCSITSGKFYATSDFKVSAVLKGNGSSGTMTSTVKFELLDANGDVVATGYANGSSTAEFTPKDGTETTYTITFTYVAGKTYKDATNLRLSFSKTTGNVSFKSLSVVA